MTRAEFGAVMLYLADGSGQVLSEEQMERKSEVYWDGLGDLPLAVFQVAAQRALAENQYPTIPPIGVLRRLATEALYPALPSAAEAWQLVQQALKCYIQRSPFTDQSEYHRAWEALPAPVQAAARAIGFHNLLTADNGTTLFAQFRDAYQVQAERVKNERLLPAPLREKLAQIGHEAGTPQPVRRLLGNVGRMPA